MKKILFFTVLIAFFYACKNDDKKDAATTTTTVKEIPLAIKKLIEDANKDSGNTEAKFKIVAALDSLGWHKEAIEKLDILITKDSLNNIYWLKRGQICKQIGDTTAAIKAFRYAAKIYPSPQAMMELANLYAETRNPLTMSVCQQLMKMNPSKAYDAQAYFFVGVYYSKIGDKANAIKLFDNSISQDFHFAEAYIEKGYLLYNEKKYNEALKVFVQLSATNPTLADGYYWQAKCNEMLNNKQQATELYNKTLVLDPAFKEAKDGLLRLKNK